MTKRVKPHETGTDNPIDFPLDRAFDDRKEVELTMDQNDLYNLMLYAHKKDITLNQLVENLLRQHIKDQNERLS